MLLIAKLTYALKVTGLMGPFGVPLAGNINVRCRVAGESL